MTNATPPVVGDEADYQRLFPYGERDCERVDPWMVLAGMVLASRGRPGEDRWGGDAVIRATSYGETRSITVISRFSGAEITYSQPFSVPVYVVRRDAVERVRAERGE